MRARKYAWITATPYVLPLIRVVSCLLYDDGCWRVKRPWLYVRAPIYHLAWQGTFTSWALFWVCLSYLAVGLAALGWPLGCLHTVCLPRLPAVSSLLSLG